VRIPIDDENSWTFRIRWQPHRPLSAEERREFEFGGVDYPELLPGTYLPKANRENNYLIDRSLQRSFCFSGIKGIQEQDIAVVETQGAISNRAREHLGTSDVAIIAMRRKLLRAIRDLQDKKEPYAAQHGEAYKVRPLALSLEREVAFDVGARQWLKAEV
jgi:hypothetical protein